MTTFDEDADDAMAIVNGDTTPGPDQFNAMIARLDEILLICATANITDPAGGVDVDPAWDYLDDLAVRPGLVHQLLVYLRWPAAKDAADKQADQFAAEAAALLGPVAARVPLPLTCASPEAHARAASRRKPLWWLREAGLLDGKPDDDQPCPVCRLPWPKSHRRNG